MFAIAPRRSCAEQTLKAWCAGAYAPLILATLSFSLLHTASGLFVAYLPFYVEEFGELGKDFAGSGNSAVGWVAVLMADVQARVVNGFSMGLLNSYAVALSRVPLSVDWLG